MTQPLLTFYLVAQVIERITELVSLYGEPPAAEKTKKQRANRSRWLLLCSTVLGLVAANVLDLRFLALANTAIDPALDEILSGIALGAGTKPVHDIIAFVEKSSAKAGK